MKSSELMIGDWVNFYPSPLAQNGIYYDRVIVLDRYDVECEPIPLTAEILEKNNCEEYRGGLFNLQDPSLGLSLESDGFVLGQDYGERGGFEGFIEIKYVHELQHALRLCGLNELADNLKV